MYMVYVQNVDGKPLMPTTRFKHVRILLKEKKARVVSTKPFVIRLNYKSTNYTQPLYGGIDPGRTNIGLAVVSSVNDTLVYAAEVETRNKEIPKLMAERKEHRKASRYGERQVRKRRAKKYETTKEFPEWRKLPRFCNDGVMNLNTIINSEAKFNNRKRPENWVTPTVRQLIQTHISAIKKVMQILPVDNWTLEYNRFAFMKLENGEVKGIDFQNGRLKGFKSKEDYISNIQYGKCRICGGPIEHYHHIVHKSKGGSNTPENLVGLCLSCHEKLHQNKLSKEEKEKLENLGLKKKYGALSVLNQAMPFIYQELSKIKGVKLDICYGYETSEERAKHKGLPPKTDDDKNHWIDAIVIAFLGSASLETVNGVKSTIPFKIKQFRNHDRSLIKAQVERTYQEFTGKFSKTGKPEYETVAKNRKARTGQPENTPSLDVWYEKRVKEVGEVEANKEISQLKVRKSYRRYNDPKRILPGVVFVDSTGKRHVLKSNSNNGRYWYAFDTEERFKSSECRVVYRSSLAYI